MPSSYEQSLYNFGIDSAARQLQWPGSPCPLILRVRSDEEDDNSLRRRMLGIHCISDLDDEARKTADMAFSSRNRNIQSAENYMDVGRAICASYGLEKNPHQAIMSYGAELGVTMPGEWSTNQDLYSAIGEQFSTRKRSEYNEAKAKAEAAAKARQEEFGRLAQSAIQKLVEGLADSITPEEHQGLEACGISRSSIEKARIACSQYLGGYGIGGQKEHYGVLEINGPRSIATLSNMADTIGDDAVALDFAMQYITHRTRIEEQSRRSGGAVSGNLGSVQSTMQQVGSVVGDYVDDTLAIPVYTLMNIKDSIFSEDVHWYDAMGINPGVRQTRRNNFIAMAKQAYATALTEAAEENPHTLDAVSGAVTSVAHAGKWLLPGKWMKAGAVMSTLMENERTAAMKEFQARGDLSFTEFNFWDSVGTPALKTGITAGTFKAVGSINGMVGGAVRGWWGASASAGAQRLAARLAQSRVAGFAGHTALSAVTMEEIAGLEWVLNMAVDHTIVSDSQNTSAELGEAIIQGWSSADGLTEKALVALIFGAMAAPGMVNKAQYERWKNTMGMSPEQSRRYDAARSVEERRAVLEEMRTADPTGFRERAAKAGELVIARAEMEALARAGIEDYILQSAGYTKTSLPDGRFELTRKTVDAEGKEVVTRHTYTQEQLNDYYATKHESLVFRSMVELQSRARGEKLAAAAERIKTPFLKIISLDKLDPELLSTLRDGQVTLSTVRALAEKARVEIDAWTEKYRAAGLSEAEARAKAEQETHNASGVPLKTLSRIDADFEKRIVIARKAGTIGKNKEASTTAFLMPRALGELTLALSRGEVKEHEVLHDLIEARIRHSLAEDPAALDKIRASLLRVDTDIRRRSIDRKGILHHGKDVENLDIIEALSHLATADFMTNHRQMLLSSETHAALETARSIMGDLQTISTLAEVWKAYAATEKGRAALADNANLLRDILEQSKAFVRDVYAEAEKQSTRDATEIIKSYDLRKEQQRRKLIEDYKASRTPLTEEQLRMLPESEKHPEEVSAADSVTGEKIPAEKFYAPETVDQTTGEIIPPPEAGAPQSAPEGKGKGLVNGVYHEGENGRIYGAVPIAGLKVADFFRSERARQNVDMHDTSTSPVLVFRDKSGNMTAIANLGRLVSGSQRGNKFVDVEIIDESKSFTSAHAADRALEYAMRTNNATPEQILAYFTRTGMKRATVYERGLIPPGADGALPSAAQIAWNIHERACPRLRSLVQKGEIDIDTAMRIADMAPSDVEAQNYIIKLKQSTRNFKWATIEKRARKFIADKFNDFVAKNQTEETTSFSVREYRERKPLEELLRESRVSQLIQRSRAVAKELSPHINLAKSDTQVQELLGRLVGLHTAIRKEFSSSPYMREAIAKDLSLSETRLRAMADILRGKTDSVNILALPEAMRKEAAEAADKLKFVCDYLRKTEGDLIERAARLIEEAEMDGELAELDALISHAHARLQKNQRSARGTVGVEAARNAERYRRMMGMSKEEVSERLNNTEAAIQKALSEESIDAAVVSRLQDQQAELMTYGALRERGLDALREGSKALREYIATEAKKWKAAQEAMLSIITHNKVDIAQAQPAIDPGKLSRSKSKDEQSRVKNLLHAFTDYENGYDLLERIAPRLPLARRWKQRLARATDALSVTLNADKRNERSWIAENLGYRTDRQMALWLERSTSVRKTGISTEGVLQTKTHYISVEEADRICRLTPEERAAERAANAAEAKSNGQMPSYPTEAAVTDMRRRIAVRGFMDDKIQYMNTGTERSEHRRSIDLELSQQQAANIVLLAEQPSYAMQMHALGYTSKVIDKLRSFAGDEVMAYAYWARGYLNNSGVRTVFEARMGVPFPAEQNYWPGNFDTSSVTDNASSFISGATMGRGIYPFLITRSLHNFEPNTSLGVNEILRLSLQAHRTYETRSAIADEMRQTLGDPDTAARMRTLMGDWDFFRFKDFISIVDGAYAADAVACRAERKVISWNNMAKTLTWLPGRLTSIAIQISAINSARAAEGVTLGKLVREIVGIRTDCGEQVMTVRRMVELDCFKARYFEDGLYERLTALPQDSKFSSLSVVANTFMRFMGMSDLWSNACGMTLLYRLEYRKMKKLYPEMPDAEIRKHCETIVSETLHLAAQPIEATDKSIRYITSSDPIAQMVWLCKSDALKSLATGRTIGRRDRQGKGLASTALMGYDFYRYLLPGSIMAQAIRGIFSVANGNAPAPDEEGYGEWILRNAVVALCLGGYIESIPLIGGALAYSSRRYVATGYSAGHRTSVDPLGIGDVAAIYDFLVLCNDILKEDKSWDARATLKMADALRGGGILFGSLLPDNQIGATVKSAFNATNTGFNVARDYLIRRTNDEKKHRRNKRKATLHTEQEHP